MSALFNIVPHEYKALLPQKLLKIDVTETKATCNSCLRARDKRFQYQFKNNLKCCTFHPYTPNFAVGGILKNVEQNPGANRILSKIVNKEFVLPIGIVAPFSYQFQFLNKEETDFGTRADLLCPYYDKLLNQCSIWNYRGVVCTSYYCRSDYGQNGQKFWAVASDYLSYVEMALAEECLVQLDFSPRDISDQLYYLNKREFESQEAEQLQLSDVTIKSIWNGYNDQVEFFKKCHTIITNLDRSQFKEIIGNQGLELESELFEYANRR